MWKMLLYGSKQTNTNECLDEGIKPVYPALCKKDELSQRWPRDAPCVITRVSEYGHGYFSRNFKWAFVPIDPMKVRTKFEVRTFTRSWDYRGYSKIWAVPEYAHAPFSPKVLMGFCSEGSFECTSQTLSPYSFSRSWEWDNSDWSFGWALRTPILGKRGDGTFERVSVSSYKPCIKFFALPLPLLSYNASVLFVFLPITSQILIRTVKFLASLSCNR